MASTGMRISWIMALVALAALDFAAVKALFRLGFTYPGTYVTRWWGALLMMNVLIVVVASIASRRSVRQPFSWGFLSFGVLALALYIAISSFFPIHVEMIISDNLSWIATLFVWGGLHTWEYALIFFAVAVVTALPQLAIALMGGVLFRHFRIVGHADS